MSKGCRTPPKNKDEVKIPFSGLPMDMWVEAQAKLVMHLAQRSRNNSGSSLRFLCYRQSSIMDWEETQVQAGQCLRCLRFFEVVIDSLFGTYSLSQSVNHI